MGCTIACSHDVVSFISPIQFVSVLTHPSKGMKSGVFFATIIYQYKLIINKVIMFKSCIRTNRFSKNVTVNFDTILTMIELMMFLI